MVKLRQGHADAGNGGQSSDASVAGIRSGVADRHIDSKMA